jgi:N-acetylglucosaminyl-diphospho-decaprenol L-rhamnosyltransferase
MQLSIIIVSYNVKYFLEQCLHSIVAACKNIEAEIIIVDNNSDDKTAEYIRPKFPTVTFIQNEKNIGFAKANNIGLSIAKGEFILYLNPDTILSDDAIANCISFLNEHKQAGAVGVKMVDGNGAFLAESKRAFPSVTASFWKLNGMANLFSRSAIFNKYALGNLNENEVHEVDVLSGAFFLSRKEILLSINGFDENFFMYGEDIDLSYRIQKKGFKNYYLGNNAIVHFKGESTQQTKSAYTKNFYGAMEIFVTKHHQKSSSFLLKNSIKMASMLSAAKRTLSNIFSNKKTIAHKNFILAGDEAAIKSAAKILAADNLLYKELFNGLANIQDDVKTNLVFCIDELPYKDCIEFMQRNKDCYIYYWHYKNSYSIISSGNTAAISQIYITE